MRTYLLSLAALVAVLATPVQAQWLKVYERNSSEAGSSFGYSMAALLDRDGDGFGEILVGAMAADANGLNSGAAYVLNGEDGSLILAIPGENAGDLFGAAVTSLRDLNSDGIQDFAVSAPYFSGVGLFSGRVYIVNGADGSFLDVLDGLVMGELFGIAIAGTDVDGDGVSELAVGAVGANGGDGQVSFYEWIGGGMALMSGGALAGASGSGEWFGFSLQNLRQLVLGPGHEMVIGAPYADDGGVDSGAVTAITNLTELRNYAPAVPGAEAGWSVSAAMNGFKGYVAGGAPALGKGSVFIWDGRTAAQLMQLEGNAAGDQFGWSVLMLPDRDFDNLPEIAVGAPLASTGKGRTFVLDFLEGASPTVLLQVTGTAGSRLGASLTEVFDVNGSTIDDLAIGSPDADAGLGRRQGRFQVWTPPDSNLPPPVLGMLNTPVLDSQVDLGIINLKENADLYLYAGTANSPGTTAEGFQMDISGYFGGSGGKDYFELASNVTGGHYTTSIQLPITIPNGATVVFQGMEVRGLFERKTSVDGGIVQDRDIELDINPEFRVNYTSTLTTKYAHRSTSAIVYYFMGLSVGNATYLGINTGLSNPFHPINSGTVPDQYGNASYLWLVPPTISGAPLANRTVLCSTVSWHSGNQRLGYYGPFTIQP